MCETSGNEKHINQHFESSWKRDRFRVNPSAFQENPNSKSRVILDFHCQEIILNMLRTVLHLIWTRIRRVVYWHHIWDNMHNITKLRSSMDGQKTSLLTDRSRNWWGNAFAINYSTLYHLLRQHHFLIFSRTDATNVVSYHYYLKVVREDTTISG